MTSAHSSELERLRLERVVDLVPKGRSTLLDVGTRDGCLSFALLPHFDRITAMDLDRPRFQESRVTLVQGDASRLSFRDDAFDSVLCAEVLEHIPPAQLTRACREIEIGRAHV